MSYTLNRQPHFRDQPKNQLVVWVYGLFTDVPGDYVKKPMRKCTGTEITEEWLYHIGVPEDKIHEYAVNSARCIPCMLPYITAFFMPRSAGDRPKVVPEKAVNFAFIGQFADTQRDTVFTTEYSVRTGMEAVYTLLNVDRGVPEVFGSVYDVRALLDSASRLMDGRKPADMKLPWIASVAKKAGLKKIRNTVVYDLLKKYNVI
jgi:oleate hydratase